MKVSILLCSYNAGDYIISTIQSILDQTLWDFELLILDNGSKDETIKNIEHFQDIRIQLFRSQENLGPYEGLNFLLKKAIGIYIAIQDHDDIWHPQKLEKQVSFLEEHAEYIGCGTNTVMYYEGDKKYFFYYLGEKNYYTIHASLLFRSTQDFFYDTKDTQYMCDAYSLKHHLCKEEKIIYNLPEALSLHLIKKWSSNYSYRWHSISWKNLKRVYELHSPIYATLTFFWELQRKIFYPLLQKIGVGKYIDIVERIPFRILGNPIQDTKASDWWAHFFKK